MEGKATYIEMLRAVVKVDVPTCVVAIMGPTCAGKSTLLNWLKDFFGDRASFVEVGKTLRAKYPPEYFQGQNNPQHTAQEAWQLCEDGIKAGRAEKRAFVFVDGQPRDIPQTDKMVQIGVRRYVMLTCSIAESEKRARATRSGSDLETLALPRIRNDRGAYYDVTTRLAYYEKQIDLIHTDEASPEEVAAEVCRLLLRYITA